MLSNPQTALAVVVTAIIFACRAVPFAPLRGRTASSLLAVLAAAMPLGVMVVLIACTLDVVSTSPASGAPAVVGVATTAGLHLWRRSTVLSLVGGTAVCIAASLALG